jgi:hypothetical protein
MSFLFGQNKDLGLILQYVIKKCRRINNYWQMCYDITKTIDLSL